MKKILTLVVYIVFLLFPLKIYADADNLKAFIKVDEEGNYINDAEFKIHSLDGSIEYEVWKEKEVLVGKAPTPISVKKLAVGDIIPNGVYSFYSDGLEDYNKVLNILGPEERQIVEDLKDYNKVLEFLELLDQDYSSEYAKYVKTRGISIYYFNNCSTDDVSTNNYDNEYNAKFMLSTTACKELRISVPVLMILEETKAPEGYKKEKAIVEYVYNIVYNFDVDNNYVDYSNVDYFVNGIYKYNSDIDYSNILDFERKRLIITNPDEMYYKNECGDYVYMYTTPPEAGRAPVPSKNILNNFGVKKIGSGEMCKKYPVIIDHKNGAVLTISSYVNNGGSTKAVKGSTVNYKVVVKNEGTSESTNNVITSKIPEGFKYVVGSASDNGEYIESTNSIRWNVSSIDVESTKELTYKVSVTEDVDLTKVYTSTATVMNDSSDEIISNETQVTLQGDIVNPKTGEINSILILFVLSVIGLIGYYIIDNKTIKGL